MNNKQMQAEALESMSTRCKGWFWNEGKESEAFKGPCWGMEKLGSDIGFQHPQEGIYLYFSFTDPRPKEAPPKGTVVMVLDFDEKWDPIPKVSEGMIDPVSGRLLASKNWYLKWRPLENGMVPKD